MTGGFSAVSDELHQVAGKIGEAVGEVTQLVWRGPSGDYGHPGVQSGWERFIEEMKSQIETLRDKADGHGQDLRGAATAYVESDVQGSQELGRAGTTLDASAVGFINPDVARRLNPDWNPPQQAPNEQEGPLY
jgi:hypothetical protein